MGTIVEQSGLAAALFTKTQRQVLDLLFGRPAQSFYLNEIVRAAGVGIGAVQREVEKAGACRTVDGELGRQPEALPSQRQLTDLQRNPSPPRPSP